MPASRARIPRTTFALILLCLAAGARSLAQGPPDGRSISPAARAYLEQALDLMQKDALHKKSIDWVDVRKETLAHAKGAQTTFDTYPAIVFAFTQLQEHHSWLQLPDSMPADKRQAITAAMTKITGKSQTESKASPFFPQKEMQAHIDRNDGNVFAHVAVPMCVGPYSDWEKNGPYFQEFADKLHRIVVDLQSQKPQGWIIDLRGNAGGNMWPMLAGIGIVIGEGDLGAFISADEERVPWFYRAGKAGVRTTDRKEEISSEMNQPPFLFQSCRGSRCCLIAEQAARERRLLFLSLGVRENARSANTAPVSPLPIRCIHWRMARRCSYATESKLIARASSIPTA